jgi:hypothetical protein
MVPTVVIELEPAAGAAPRFVNAPKAVVDPVPPFSTAIAVPLQVPAVMVPTVFKFDNEVNVVFDVAVMFPAVVAVEALPVVF